MAELYDGPRSLAPTGTTTNITGTALEAGADYDGVVFHFVAEAVGATPTVTFKFQGSPDNSNWYDVAYITDATDTVAVATITVTAVGGKIAFLANPVARQYRWFRVVTSAILNVTYRAEMYLVD